MELSYFWGGAVRGDAVIAPYDPDEFDILSRSAICSFDRSKEGIISANDPAYSDQLECFTPGGTDYTVATGMAMVDGKIYTNDADISGTADDEGYYLVVLSKSWDDQTVRVKIVGPSPTKPEPIQTEWLYPFERIRPGGHGSAPPITGTPRRYLWQIPLAMLYSDGSTVTRVEDLREFVGCSQRRTRFVPALCGYQTATFYATSTGVSGVEMPDDVVSRVVGSLFSPQEFFNSGYGGEMKIYALIQAVSAGHVNFDFEVRWGELVGHPYNEFSDLSPAAFDMPADIIVKYLAHDLTIDATTTYFGVTLQTQRNIVSPASWAGDIAGDLQFLGWRIEYKCWR